MAVCGLLACACASDDAKRHELPGLTVVQNFDGAICAGTLPYFERRLTWLEEQTGLSRDPRGLVYHWYLDPMRVEEACSFSLGGCAKERTFYGNLLVFSHELVHAHLSRLGSPRVWLEEGMATMLEDDSSFAPDPQATPSAMMQIDDALALNYAAAGAFTTYLRERYGMALLLEYYESSASAGATASLAIFEDVLGDSFADVEADYLDGGMPATHTSLDCDGPDVAWSGDTWEHTFRLACEEPTAIGPEQSQSDAGTGTFLWSTVTMTAPAGWISLDLATADPAWISLLSCERSETAYVDADQPHAEAYLAGGRYLVFADAFIADAPTARVKVRQLEASPAPLRPGPTPGLFGHARMYGTQE